VPAPSLPLSPFFFPPPLFFLQARPEKIAEGIISGKARGPAVPPPPFVSCESGNVGGKTGYALSPFFFFFFFLPCLFRSLARFRSHVLEPFLRLVFFFPFLSSSPLFSGRGVSGLRRTGPSSPPFFLSSPLSPPSFFSAQEILRSGEVASPLI